MNVQNYGLVFLQCISIAFSINVSIGNLIDVDYESGENDRSVAVDQHGGPPLPTICMGELGCFPITPDFVHSKLRPINVTPWPRDKIRTKFLLYTKQSPRDSYQLFAWNDKNLALSSFDKRLPVKVIIPGWLDSRDISKWMRSMKDVLIEYTNTNVIVTEWTNLTPYLIAATNARVVGAEVANLVNFLVQVGGIHAEQVHLIGHSVGAHVAGYAGQRIRHLGRISGLDPAKMFFQGMPASVTLDPSDANFVDIIHSDPNPVMPVGYTESLGHVDFYPNGGSPQPGCMVRDRLFRGIEDGLQDLSVSSAILQASRYGTLCSHQFSHKWFEKSIISGATGQCQFVGVKCDNYGDFLNGQCSCDDGQDACAIMGLKAEELFFSGLSGQSSGSKWYLQASGRQPFCYYQYQLIIKLLNNPNCYQGPALIKLSFNFHSDNDQQDGGRQVSVDQTMKNMYAGLRMPYVMTTDEPIGEVYSIFLSWTPIDQDGVVLGQEPAHDPVMYLKYIRLSRIEAHYGQNKAPLTNFYHPGNLNSGISPYTSILLHADSIT